MSEEMEKKPKEKFFTKRKLLLLATLVILLFILLGAFFSFFKTSAPPASPLLVSPHDDIIGSVDLARAEKAHEVYEQIVELNMQRAAIVADIERLYAARRSLQLPTLADEPFQYEAEQKDSQQKRLSKEALAREQRRALAAWEKDTLEAFLTEKKTLEDSYRNRLVNIELKIDNSEAMRLSEAEVAALRQEFASLRKERQERLKALSDAREEEKRRYLAALAERYQAKRYGETAAKEEAARQNAQAQMRNSKALLQAMQSIEIDELLYRKQAALTAKDEEIRIIKEHIRKDIESKVAKIALAHHLSIVLPKETDEASSVKPLEIDGSFRNFPITALTGLDLTDEVIAELSSKNTIGRSE